MSASQPGDDYRDENVTCCLAREKEGGGAVKRTDRERDYEFADILINRRKLRHRKHRHTQYKRLKTRGSERIAYERLKDKPIRS